MTKEEKLKEIAEALKETETGLSIDEVIAYLQKNADTLRDKRSTKFLPGMYVYANGQISAEIIEGRQIVAVVGYASVERSNFAAWTQVLAVCLQEKSMDWNEAAQYCKDYAEDWVKQGKTHRPYMPSENELRGLTENVCVINKSLKALKAPELSLNYAYWSSSDYNFNRKTIVLLRKGLSTALTTCESAQIRPVISLSFN